MTLQEFLSSPNETARRAGPHDRIVLSSRVRLARNLRGVAFPGWAKKAERIKTLEAIRPAVESLPQMASAFSETMDNLGPL
ncbi:MAG: ATP--guanido phosphotransferase, partial [Verrucomicrobiota bacterium]